MTTRIRLRRVAAVAACAALAACTATVERSRDVPPTAASPSTAASVAETEPSLTPGTAASTSSSSTSSSSTSSSTSSTTSTTSTSTTTTSTSTTTTSSTSTTTIVLTPDNSPIAADGLPWATLPPVLPHTESSPIWYVRPPSDIPAPPIPDDWVVEPIATSHLGRSVEVWHRVPEGATTRIMVVGGIHGNEPVSPPIVRSLVDVDYPDHVAVWLVPVLNPDGSVSGTRSNGVGVDLNRNFGWNWWTSDGGGEPFSQPETAAIAGLIDAIGPALVVWVHQPLGYVSSIGTTPDAYEQAWSRGSGVPVRPDVTQHGGGESWTNLTRGIDSMLVEVDTWAATPEIVAAHRNGFLELLALL